MQIPPWMRALDDTFRCGRVDGYFRERFLRDVSITGQCWNWAGLTDEAGNGKVFVGDDPHDAHDVAYALLVKGFDAGRLQAHPVCGNPKCCNPVHLDIVSRQTSKAAA